MRSKKRNWSGPAKLANNVNNAMSTRTKAQRKKRNTILAVGVGIGGLLAYTIFK